MTLLRREQPTNETLYFGYTTTDIGKSPSWLRNEVLMALAGQLLTARKGKERWKGHEDYQGDGGSLLRRKAEGAGAVQPFSPEAPYSTFQSYRGGL